jgi:hypothetical protein
MLYKQTEVLVYIRERATSSWERPGGAGPSRAAGGGRRAWRKRGVRDQWYSICACPALLQSQVASEAWPGTCAAASGEAASSFDDDLERIL